MRNNKISFSNYIRNDYLSIFLLILLFMSWVIFVALAMTVSYMYVPILTSFLFIGLVFFRFKRIESIYKKGRLVIGKRLDSWIEGDRGRINYEYELDDVIYKNGVAIHKTQTTVELFYSDRFEVLVSSKNNKKSIIKRMYE